MVSDYKALDTALLIKAQKAFRSIPAFLNESVNPEIKARVMSLPILSGTCAGISEVAIHLFYKRLLLTQNEWQSQYGYIDTLLSSTQCDLNYVHRIYNDNKFPKLDVKLLRMKNEKASLWESLLINNVTLRLFPALRKGLSLSFVESFSIPAYAENH